jgi:succinate dehydrogenase/fumarate reductase-like Fe-S protein
MRVSCRVKKQNPGEASRWASYEIEISEGASIIDLLQEISKQDIELAFTAHHCKVGICGGCTMLINGTKRLACRTIVTAPAIRLEPAPGVPLIKDLLVDLFALQQKDPSPP